MLILFFVENYLWHYIDWEHCFLLLSNDIFALARMSLRHRVEQVILQNLSLIAKEKVFCWALLSISGIATIK